MRFKTYLTERFSEPKFRSREWLGAIHDAHRDGVIWVWTPTAGLAWAWVDARVIHINNRKHPARPEHGDPLDVHGDLLAAIHRMDTNLYKKFNDAYMGGGVYGRVTKDGKILIYDQDRVSQRMADKAVDAIYRYVKL